MEPEFKIIRVLSSMSEYDRVFNLKQQIKGDFLIRIDEIVSNINNHSDLNFQIITKDKEDRYIVIKSNKGDRIFMFPDRNYYSTSIIYPATQRIERSNQILVLFDNALEDMLLNVRYLPNGSEDALMRTEIRDGEKMVTFHNEYENNRFYKESTFNSLQNKNPFTRQPITSSEKYIAKIQKGGKRRRTNRSKRTHKNNR